MSSKDRPDVITVGGFTLQRKDVFVIGPLRPNLPIVDQVWGGEPSFHPGFTVYAAGSSINIHGRSIAEAKKHREDLIEFLWGNEGFIQSQAESF